MEVGYPFYPNFPKNKFENWAFFMGYSKFRNRVFVSDLQASKTRTLVEYSDFHGGIYREKGSKFRGSLKVLSANSPWGVSWKK